MGALTGGDALYSSVILTAHIMLSGDENNSNSPQASIFRVESVLTYSFDPV